MLRSLVPVIAAALLGSPLYAQSDRTQNPVPPGHRPPAGMCRIWIDAVPPGQQAAPTDCATAVRNRPANGRVLFGDDNPKPGHAKGFSPKSLRDDDAKVRTDDDSEDRSPKLVKPKVTKTKKKDQTGKPKPKATKGSDTDI